ncbi:MAG TPA: histone deacetylase [Rubrobacteraceae bacterium]|nr:histone deacetylase [Rubrobacteraceae bacterium]
MKGRETTGRDNLHVYTDAAMRDHVNGLSHVEVPERFPAAIAGVEAAESAGVAVEWRASDPAPEEALLAVHERSYLEKLERVCGTGGGFLGTDTAAGPGSWEAALLGAGCAVGAVESALSGETAFAAVRPPGHHAGRATAMGFCLLNNAAIAAEHVRSLGKDRIAILDWDVHHGNGTQDIFYEDGEILYLSVHRSPFYPGTGAAKEVGAGEGRGMTVNVPLPRGTGEATYAVAFAGVLLPILRAFRPELLIVSAGYDAHADDPLGGMRLQAESFGRFAATLDALVREIGAAPLVMLLEGGYDLAALTGSIASTLRGIGQEPPDWNMEGDPDDPEVENSREALEPYWHSLR